MPVTEASTKTDVMTALKKKVADFVEDTVTLDVLTTTGTIDLVLPKDKKNPKTDGKAFDWDAIFERVAAELKPDGDATKVSIVAYTHAEWDQDSVNFVASNADPDLVDAHGKTVAASHEARMKGLKATADAVGKLFT